MTADTKKISVTAHLSELRKRLIVCVGAISVGFAVSYYYSEGLFSILTKPLVGKLPDGHDYLVFTSITEPFFIYLKVGLLGGGVLASPIILYEIWAFVAPGLYRDEKNWFFFMVSASFVLFMAGTGFAYGVVFPFGFKYLLNFAGQELRPVLAMGLYFSMVVRLMFAFGIIFQMPLVMLALSRFGLVTAAQFGAWWRYAIVGILLVAAILTPTPDIVNQLLMAGPMIALYFLGIIASWIFGRKRDVSVEHEMDSADFTTR